MIKRSTKEVKRTREVAEYYCDRCGIHLGTFDEFDDGYIPEPYENRVSVDVKVHIGNKCEIFETEGFMCKACAQTVVDRFKYQVDICNRMFKHVNDDDD